MMLSEGRKWWLRRAEVWKRKSWQTTIDKHQRTKKRMDVQDCYKTRQPRGRRDSGDRFDRICREGCRYERHPRIDDVSSWIHPTCALVKKQGKKKKKKYHLQQTQTRRLIRKRFDVVNSTVRNSMSSLHIFAFCTNREHCCHICRRA